MKNSIPYYFGLLLLPSLLCAAQNSPCCTSHAHGHQHDPLPETVITSIAGMAQGILTIAASDNPYDKELLAEQGQDFIEYLSHIALAALHRTKLNQEELPSLEEMTVALRDELQSDSHQAYRRPE